MSDDLFSALNPIISDLVNPSVSQALALGKKGQSIPVKLPSGIIVLAKAQNEINSPKVLLAKTGSGGYLCYSSSSPKPTKRTQNIFKKRPQNIVKKGNVKILLVTQNKDDETKADIYIGGDRSPAEFITTISNYDKIQFANSGITSTGTGLNDWVISICQQFGTPDPLSIKITFITPDGITTYENYAITWYGFLEYKGNGVYSIPRMSQFHYKDTLAQTERAESIDTNWFFTGAIVPITYAGTSQTDGFIQNIFGNSLILYTDWLNQQTFPLLTANLPSLTFANTDFNYGQLNTALNAIVGGDFITTITPSFTYSQFSELQIFPLPSNYGYPSYCDDPYNIRLFEGGAEVNLVKSIRQINFEDLLPNPFYFVNIYLQDVIVWNNANIPPHARLDSRNEFVLSTSKIETPVQFFHTTIAENKDLSSLITAKGIKTVKDLRYSWLRENYTNYLFEKPAQSSTYESHLLLAEIPLSNTFKLTSSITKSVNGSNCKITGSYNDLILAGNGVYLTELITLKETNFANNNETEWHLTSDTAVLTTLIDLDDLDVQTSIKRITDDPVVMTVRYSTLASNQSLAIFDTIPSETTEKHPVRIYSVSGDKYSKNETTLPVTLTYPDDRVYVRVSISYHP